MSEHSILSASASDRWAACPISVLGPPSQSGPAAAAEGTLGHTIAEAALRGEPYPATGEVFTVEGHTFEVNDSFITDIAAYVQHVRNTPWLRAYTPEGKVNYSRALGVPYNTAFGTADCWGFSQDATGRYLEIMDLKMGRNAVNPERNPQMALYAAGVLDGMHPYLVLPQDHKVRLTIFQPRLSHRPFQWVTTVGWVEAHALYLRPAAHAALAYKQGTANMETWAQFPEALGDHCRYCTRKPQCRAFQDKLRKAATAVGAFEWDAQIFAMSDAIKNYLKDMEQLAFDAAMAGKPYPGTKLVKGRAGNPVLQIPKEQVRAVAKAMGIEEVVVRSEEVWATPAKIRDGFKRHGMPPAELVRIVQSPEGAPQLALAADPRPEVNRGADVSFFTGVAMPQ
jgi:hypothetical protein